MNYKKNGLNWKEKAAMMVASAALTFSPVTLDTPKVQAGENPQSKNPTAELQRLKQTRVRVEIQGQSNTEEYDNMARRAIQEFVQENEILVRGVEERFGEKLLNEGQYSPLFIQPGLSRSQIQQDLTNHFRNTAVKIARQRESSDSVSATRIVMVHYPNGTITGIAVTVYDNKDDQGNTSFDVKDISTGFHSSVIADDPFVN